MQQKSLVEQKTINKPGILVLSQIQSAVNFVQVEIKYIPLTYLEEYTPRFLLSMYNNQQYLPHRRPIQ